jgi:phosphonate transport system ATP-binding protein
MIEPDSGSVTLAGRDIMAAKGTELRDLRRSAAMVFQQIHLVRRRTAFENVCYGALGRIHGWRAASYRVFPPDVIETAWQSLERVGLAEKAWQRADTLSGGQQQRVAIARALCQKAEVILADEPVSALDPRAANTVLALLADIARKDGLAVACVLHQPDLARTYGDRIIGVSAGEIAFERTPASIQDDDIAHLYHGELDDE